MTLMLLMNLGFAGGSGAAAGPANRMMMMGIGSIVVAIVLYPW